MAELCYEKKIFKWLLIAQENTLKKEARTEPGYSVALQSSLNILSKAPSSDKPGKARALSGSWLCNRVTWYRMG